jgi:membrane-bound serine protease (ClpP class)
MLVALVMAMVDVYPGTPALPTFGQLRLPIEQILMGLAGAVIVVFGLSQLLPKTPIYHQLVSSSASGVTSVSAVAKKQAAELGQSGVALSPLRPGGKAQFGDRILDVITQGELIPSGRRVRVIGHSATEAIVESAD